MHDTVCREALTMNSLCTIRFVARLRLCTVCARYGLSRDSDYEQSVHDTVCREALTMNSLCTIRFVARLRLWTVCARYGLSRDSDYEQSVHDTVCREALTMNSLCTIRFVTKLRLWLPAPEAKRWIFRRKIKLLATRAGPPSYTLTIALNIDLFVLIFCFCAIPAAKSTEYCRQFFEFIWARIKTRPWIMYAGD